MMRTNFYLGLLLSLTTILAFTACQERNETPPAPFVKPPIPELNPDFSTFDYSASIDTVYRLPSGTEVHVPARAFIDEKGQIVEAEVRIKFRELHKATDIYLAGIPMDYQSGDQSVPFQTAGSFELRAESEQKPLELAAFKKIEVKLASNEMEDDYDFYFLNEKHRRWDSLGTRLPETNMEKKKLAQKIGRMVPELKFPLNRKYLAFNYNAILDVYLDNKLDSVNHRHMKERMSKYGLGWENIDTRQEISFEGQKEYASLMVWKNISKRKFPAWTEGLVGRLEHQKGHQYLLKVISKDSSQEFSSKLKAIMTLKTLFAFSPEKWTRDYQGIMAKVREERQRMEMMAEVYRSFEVSNLGIYNWDRFMKMNERVDLAAEFHFEETLNDAINTIEVVFIPGDNRSVVKYPQNVWPRMAIVPDPRGKFFALLPGQKIAVFPPSEYAKIDFEALRSESDPRLTVAMKTLSRKTSTTVVQLPRPWKFLNLIQKFSLWG